MSNIRRLRIFAGPNGSGKSSLVKIVQDNGIDLGIYVNADVLNVNLLDKNQLDFSDYQVDFDFENFCKTFEKSTFFEKAGGSITLNGLDHEGNTILIIQPAVINDYFTSFLADYIRNLLLTKGVKFSFETVMSHSSKIDFLKLAKKQGYKVYLYFISVDNPDLCIERVKARVLQNGHNVPQHKISERYFRTMDLLIDALRTADSSYLFDNSYSAPNLFASASNQQLRMENKIYAPTWFGEYVLNKIS